MIKFKQKGDFSNFDNYCNRTIRATRMPDIERFAETCLENLIAVTPKDSGLTAQSWNYEIDRDRYKVTVTFNNTNIQNGVNVALLLEFDHGTANGGFVAGKDYIAPTVQKAYMDAMDDAWKKVKRS